LNENKGTFGPKKKTRFSHWKPTQKSPNTHTRNISHTHTDSKPVLIDGGRATADPEFGIIRYNFWNQQERFLTSAIWFSVLPDDRDKHKNILTPLSDLEAVAVEDFYQRAVYAASSRGDGIQKIMEERIPVEKDMHVCIQQESSHYILRKCPDGWFGRNIDLQRGYGSYSVPGEEEETALGPVRHLVYVIHGIGEAMWSREDVAFAGSVVKEVGNWRLTMQQRQLAEWKSQCERAKKQK